MSIYTETQMIGALLKGGSYLFGARVELSWPDGPPMPEEELRSIGERWAPQSDPQWVRADAQFCRAQVPCGEKLADGKCSRHGRP